jgi:predicted nicotinamide N-methyase
MHNTLDIYIKKMLPSAKISVQSLPQAPQVKLYLVDPELQQQKFDLDDLRAIWNHTAYWAFCWASGQALAQWIFANPEEVSGKTILDFGTGSGVVAIAAKLAGAKRVVACDIDQEALDATHINAELNNVDIELAGDLFSITETFDLLIAADVLYDRANLPLLNAFNRFAPDILIADSRVKENELSPYVKFHHTQSSTEPDLDELDEFRYVNFYRNQK